MSSEQVARPWREADNTPGAGPNEIVLPPADEGPESAAWPHSSYGQLD
jgi:hypothetical protein